MRVTQAARPGYEIDAVFWLLPIIAISLWAEIVVEAPSWMVLTTAALFVAATAASLFLPAEWRFEIG